MYPYPFLDESEDTRSEPTYDSDRIQVNVFSATDFPQHIRRKTTAAGDRKFSRTETQILLGCGTFTLVCIAWHLAGNYHQQQAEQRQRQHQTEIEQLHQKYETMSAEHRAVKEILCPVP